MGAEQRVQSPGPRLREATQQDIRECGRRLPIAARRDLDATPRPGHRDCRTLRSTPLRWGTSRRLHVHCSHCDHGRNTGQVLRRPQGSARDGLRLWRHRALNGSRHDYWPRAQEYLAEFVVARHPNCLIGSSRPMPQTVHLNTQLANFDSPLRKWMASKMPRPTAMLLPTSSPPSSQSTSSTAGNGPSPAPKATDTTTIQIMDIRRNRADLSGDPSTNHFVQALVELLLEGNYTALFPSAVLPNSPCN